MKPLADFNPRKYLIPILIGLGIIVLTILLFKPLSALAGVEEPTQTWPQSSIQNLQAQLANPNLDPDLRQSLEEKLSAFQTQQAAQNRIQALAAPKPADPCALAPTPNPAADPPRATGILNEGAVPFPASQVTITNQWQEKLNGQWVHAYAGASVGAPQQGMVIITIEDSPAGGQFFTPDLNGPLTITAAENGRLTLVSNQGSTYYFDIPAMQFVDSLQAIVATITPYPVQPTQAGPCSP
jgi:hypothetical protein